jgi:hypothetical protein
VISHQAVEQDFGVINNIDCMHGDKQYYKALGVGLTT